MTSGDFMDAFAATDRSYGYCTILVGAASGREEASTANNVLISGPNPWPL